MEEEKEWESFYFEFVYQNLGRKIEDILNGIRHSQKVAEATEKENVFFAQSKSWLQRSASAVVTHCETYWKRGDYERVVAVLKNIPSVLFATSLLEHGVHMSCLSEPFLALLFYYTPKTMWINALATQDTTFSAKRVIAAYYPDLRTTVEQCDGCIEEGQREFFPCNKNCCGFKSGALFCIQLVEICLCLHSLRLPPYVLLEIIDLVLPFDRYHFVPKLSHKQRIERVQRICFFRQQRQAE